MKKKYIFYFGIFVIIIGILIGCYFFLQPKEAPVLTGQYTNNNNINYQDVNNYVYEKKETVYLFFYSSDEVDSKLVIDKYLNTIIEENGLESLNNLVYVDLADLPKDTDSKYTKNNWGFYHYPTFVAMQITDKDGNVISDIMEWDANSPYSKEDVEAWLQKHHIY